MPAEYPSDIKKTHPFYDANINDWRLVNAAFNGGSEFVNNTYIVQHSFESEAEYKKRIERAMYFNIVRRTITQLVRMIMAEGVIRRGTEEFGQILDDATGYGTPWGPFFQDAGVVSAMYGNAHMIVDYAISEDDSEIKTMADVKESDAFPTLELFTPMEMINWRKKRRKGYEWCIFKTTRIVEDKEKDVYIKVDYENVQEVTGEGEAVTEPYAHGLGFTPIVDVPYPSVHKKNLQRGLGVDLSHVAKGILNLSSLAEEVAERHAFNQLTMPDDGAIEEMQARQSDYLNFEVAPEIYDAMANGQDPVLQRIGRSTVMTFPAQTGHPPGFISPDSSQLADIWTVNKDSISMALFCAGLIELGGKTDITTMAATLTDLAATMQAAETKALKIAGAYVNKQSDELSVVYPTSFSIETFDNWLKNFSTMAGIQSIDDEFKLSVLQGMVLKMPGHMTQIEKAQLSATMELVEPEPMGGGFGDSGGGAPADDKSKSAPADKKKSKSDGKKPSDK